MLRRLAGMALLVACVVTYWIHFGNRFADLEAETSLRDASGRVSAAERQRLRVLRDMLREEFGVSARLVVHDADESTRLPQVAGNTLYMAVSPERGEARIVLPSLLLRALEPSMGPEPDKRLVERLSLCVVKDVSAVGRCMESVLLDTLAALGTSAPASSSAVAGTAVRGTLNTIRPAPEPQGASERAMP